MHEPRMRGRLVVAAVALAAVTASGRFLDGAIGPRKLAATASSDAVTGSWYCPHGGGEGWSGWVAIANPGPAAVTVRATTYADRGVTAVSTFAVGSRRQVVRSVPVTDPGSTTQIEYFGGWVGAAAVMTSGGDQPGAAAGRCVPSPRNTWYLLDQTTRRDQTAYVIVMNPFAETAQFDVAIRTERRSGAGTVRPGPLSPFVIAPGTSVGIKLNRYVLQAANERTMAVQVTSRSGRVVAGGVGISPEGIREEAGVPWPAARGAVPTAGHEGVADVALANPGDSRSDVVVIGQSGQGQRIITDVNGVSVPAEGVRTVHLEGLEAGALIESTNDRALVAMMRLAGPSGDLATISAGSPAPRWLVLPSVPPAGGQSYLVLDNPGQDPAAVTIRLFGPDGAVAAPGLASRVLQPGRLFQIDLSKAVGSGPLTVEVVATKGSIVAGSASSLEGRGYAATLGVPIPPGLVGPTG